MTQFFQYYGKVQGVRGNLMGLPQWARAIVFVFAMPGIVLLSLSILAVVVSVVALLLLTVPVYVVLKNLTRRPEPMEWSGPPADAAPRRHVDVKIIEQTNG